MNRKIFIISCMVCFIRVNTAPNNLDAGQQYYDTLKTIVEMAQSVHDDSNETLIRTSEILHRLMTGDEDGIIIWNIEAQDSGKPALTTVAEELHYKDFKSDKVYVLLELRKQSAQEKSTICEVYYWLGEHTSAVNASEGAAAAVMMNFLVPSLTSIHREASGEESLSFKEVFAREEARTLKTQSKQKEAENSSQPQPSKTEKDVRSREKSSVDQEKTADLEKKEKKPELVIIQIKKTQDGNMEETFVNDTSSKLAIDACYVMDRGGNGEILVWMGALCDLFTQMQCARKAELFLREKNYKYTTHVVFIKEKDTPPVQEVKTSESSTKSQNLRMGKPQEEEHLEKLDVALKTTLGGHLPN